MPNLKDIKTRIKSVQNTQKITRAMKMVAAAKVKKAEALLKASMPYSSELLTMIEKVIAVCPYIDDKTNHKFDRAIDNYPGLLEDRELKSAGILVITSDKGLAGAYNTNVVRKTLFRIRELESLGIDVKLFVVGNKGYQALRKKEGSKIINFYTKFPAVPTPGACTIMAEDIAESYINREIDKLEIITTYFKSSLFYEVQTWRLLPMIFTGESEQEEQKKCIESEMMFEPNVESVLQKIVPLYISNRIFYAVIEAATSELAARMQAMSSATENAGDMIKSLVNDYNKARQSSITQELLEVISGAEALKG